MAQKETPSSPTGPSLAWVSRKGQSQDPPSEHQRADLLQVTSSVSWPRHADSPSSNSITTFSSVTSDSGLQDALRCMQTFIQKSHQESNEKLQFLDCVDLVSTVLEEKGERVLNDYYDASLMRETLQFILPWASSPNSQDREMALARLTRLISCIPRHAIGKGKKDLKLGQLAGCFTLCCSDTCEEVSLWAADGLHRLYNLIIQLKCRTMTPDNPKYEAVQKEWREEKIFWLAWFSDVTTTTRVFKRLLRAEDQTDFILMAIRGMKKDSVHNTQCATCMLRTMLKDPVPDLVKASKVIPLTYRYLEHITDNLARVVIFYYLRLLGSSYPEEVVKALLGCSLQCDSTSAAMWRALTVSSDPTMRILTTLQSILLEQPINLGETKVALNPLAAISALYEILRHPTAACKEVLKEIYPTLSIALLCQISYTMHLLPQETEIYWRTCIEQKTPTPLPPFRSALRTFKALLRCTSHRDEVLIMNQRRGSELLLNPATHQKGLYLFARAMIRNEGYMTILPYLLKVLEYPEDYRHVTVMTFLVELLRHGTFSSIAEYQIIRQLWKQLNASQVELRSLALDGMLELGEHPEQMAMLEPALPDILARLKESNRAVNVKALKVLRYLLKSLQGQQVSSITTEVAAQVMPLFDDASHKVRLEAITVFSCLFGLIKKNEKESMKVQAIKSLIPLMVHLYDGSPQVAQASWDALKTTDGYLKSFFQLTIKRKDPWRYCIGMVNRYRKRGESVLVDQAFSYLEAPQQSLRETALKLLEIIAKGSKCRETISAVATVLNLVKREPETNTTNLVPHVMVAMAQDSSSDTLQVDCCGTRGHS